MLKLRHSLQPGALRSPEQPVTVFAVAVLSYCNSFCHLSLSEADPAFALMSILFSTEEAAHLIFWVSFLISVWKIEISFLVFVPQLSLYLKEVKCISTLRYIEIFFGLNSEKLLVNRHSIFHTRYFMHSNLCLAEFYWLVTFLWLGLGILFIHQSSQALFFTLLDFFLSLSLI